MKNLLPILAFLLLPTVLSAQLANSAPNCLDNQVHMFSSCAAIFLNDEMLVEDYSPNAVCMLDEGATGILAVSVVSISTDMIVPYENIGFKVAIRNSETNTLWLFSEETFLEVDLEKVLAKCKLGDRIVLLTVDEQYSLPHNEIFFGGC